MGKQKSPQARMARTVPVRQLYGVHLRKRPEGQQPEPADHEQHDTAYRGGTAQERPKIGTRNHRNGQGVKGTPAHGERRIQERAFPASRRNIPKSRKAVLRNVS